MCLADRDRFHYFLFVKHIERHFPGPDRTIRPGLKGKSFESESATRSGVRQGAESAPPPLPPTGRVRPNTPAGRELNHV